MTGITGAMASAAKKTSTSTVMSDEELDLIAAMIAEGGFGGPGEAGRWLKLLVPEVRRNRARERGKSDVLAAAYWPTNGHMVEDLHRLGYLLDTDRVLDPTFENGVWWQQWRPAELTTCHRGTDGTDFRHLDFPSHSFDAITYDPPYVCPGGRKTSTMQGFHDRFGMAEGHEDPMFSTPEQLQEIINDGLTEMVRLVKPAGLVLVKCQNYVWSGRLFEGAEHTRAHALELGCMVVDRLEFLGHPRPQPSKNPDGSDRRQVHARRNLSTLFVFRAPNVDTRQQVLL